VRWKGFTAESDTWKGRENLENAKEAVEEFEKEYWRDIEEINRQEREEGTFRRGKLLGRFMARKLFGWSDKQYVRLANSKAGIKPTAPLLAFDKENSIEFLLDSLHYLYNYYMVCALLSHAYHVTYHVTSCDMML